MIRYLLLTFAVLKVHAFVVRPTALVQCEPNLGWRQASIGSEQDVTPVESMRIKEIQQELSDRKVSYTDCFDKESLVKRLQEARETGTLGDDNSEKVVEDVVESGEESAVDKGAKLFDREAKLAELRAMKVRGLREECAKRRIRWAQFVEKEELVQALLEAIEKTVGYSVSGFIQPGEVADLRDDQLELELSETSDAPLLLDIYATWCGPCKMMAPELVKAATELGGRMRVAKLDSDRNPKMAQRLQAGGLPTLLILNGSEELQRIEGALMKDQIMQWVGPYVQGSR